MALFNKYDSFDNVSAFFFHDLSDAELLSKYDDSHLFFHTSEAEGFPLVVQEAFSRSLIIIADKSVVNRVIPSNSVFDLDSNICNDITTASITFFTLLTKNILMISA